MKEQKEVIKSKTLPLFDYFNHNSYRLHRKPCGKVKERKTERERKREIARAKRSDRIKD